MPAARWRHLPSCHRDPTTGDRQEGVRRHVPSEPAPNRGAAPHRPVRSGRRLPRCRLHVQGRPDRLAPPSRVLSRRSPARTGETADRVDRPRCRMADPHRRRSLTACPSTRPASSRASCCSAAGSSSVSWRWRSSSRSCSSTPARRSARPTPPCLRDLVTVLPFIVAFAAASLVAAAGLASRQALGGRPGGRRLDRRGRHGRDRPPPDRRGQRPVRLERLRACDRRRDRHRRRLHRRLSRRPGRDRRRPAAAPAGAGAVA